VAATVEGTGVGLGTVLAATALRLTYFITRNHVPRPFSASSGRSVNKNEVEHFSAGWLGSARLISRRRVFGRAIGWAGNEVVPICSPIAAKRFLNLLRFQLRPLHTG